jgi:uncharacterized protein involved in exopolysaccharide biosynthesis
VSWIVRHRTRQLLRLVSWLWADPRLVTLRSRVGDLIAAVEVLDASDEQHNQSIERLGKEAHRVATHIENLQKAARKTDRLELQLNSLLRRLTFYEKMLPQLDLARKEFERQEGSRHTAGVTFNENGIQSEL